MKRYWLLFLSVCLLVSLSGCGKTPAGNAPETTADTTPTEKIYPQNSMTGEELMNELKIGWNLGNTFDAPEGELAWGQPVTSPELLKLVKELGFNTIRIPISWHKHVSEDYTIDEAFLTRIDTVVNQALDCGLYVIINSHHDNSIYCPTPDNQEAATIYLSAIWKQIAEHYKDMDYRLIFQGMNEPRVEGTSYEWAVNTQNPDSMAAVDVINVLNQTVVDTVRATGGYNAQRWIIVSPYAANSGAAMLNSFRLPSDPADKLIVSIHAYAPYDLCLNTHSDLDTLSSKGKNEISSMMKNLNRVYVSKGIPVIIDEMGCLNKNNDQARYEWAKYYISAAREQGIVCCWWDNGSTTVAKGTEGFGLINRRKLSVYECSQPALNGLMEGLEATE